MADGMEEPVGSEPGRLAEPPPGDGEGKRGRGRPRLSDTDRLQRRLNSRKKYDNRRIYIGESYVVWAALRERYGWSDKRLALHLVQLEQGGPRDHRRHSKSGAEEQNSKINSSQKVKKQAVSSLKTLVVWYEHHKQTCKQEPVLYELQRVCECSVAIVWQCEAGHQYLQCLEPVQKNCHSPDAEPAAKDSVAEETQRQQHHPATKKVRKGKRGTARRKPGQSNELYMKCESDTSTCDGSDSEQKFEEYFNVKLIDVDASDSVYDTASKEGGVNAKVLSSGGKPNEAADKNEDSHGTEVGELASPCRVPSPCKSSNGEDHLALPAELPALANVPQTVEKDALSSLTANCPVTVQLSTVQSSEITSITESEFGQVPLDTAQPVNPAEYEEMTCTFSEQLTYVNPVGECYTITGQTEGTEWSEHPGVIGERTVIDDSALPATEPKEAAQKTPHKPKRKKGGYIIDADGMFQLFHCPHEGCSQVYITLNSFQAKPCQPCAQKGKTKVCSHPGCGKRFYLSNHLRRHMIIHSGVRDFICETCGKSFKRKNHLEVHRRMHTGETPLQCEICGYQCRQRASLNWHMKKHDTEIQYNFTCEYCGKKFEKMESVKFHKLKSHPECQTM